MHLVHGVWTIFCGVMEVATSEVANVVVDESVADIATLAVLFGERTFYRHVIGLEALRTQGAVPRLVN